MPGRDVPRVKKFALLEVHGRKCVYCDEPLLCRDMTVDHVLPVRLLDHRNELQIVLGNLGLPDDFELNNYDNWLPACASCNQKKGAAVLVSAATHLLLHAAKKAAGKARKLEAALVRRTKGDKVVAMLEVALEQGSVSPDKVLALLRAYHETHVSPQGPVVLTFGLNLADLDEERALPPEAPEQYADLCDWLERDLQARLSRAVSCEFFCPEASLRTGETLSIRLGFIGLNFAELDHFSSDWWEILEIAFWSQLYEEEWEG